MGLAQLLQAHYTNQNRGMNHRQIVLPQAVGAGNCDGATVTAGAALTWGAWIDVALLALIGTDTLVVGVVVDSPSATGVEIWTIDIGSTLVTVGTVTTAYATAATIETAGAAAMAAAHRAEIRLEIASDAGIYQPIMLEYPVLIPSGTGIIARGYTVSGSDGGADTINVSVLLVQNFEGRLA